MIERVIRAMGFEPVADIDQFWRWWSVRLQLLAAAIGTAGVAFNQLPPAWTAAFPQWLGTALTAAAVSATILGVLLRGADQASLRHDKRGDP